VAGDSFAALDGAPAESVAPGEVAYTTGPEVLTRHLMWRQSRLGALTPSSRQVILVSEMLPGQGDLAATVGEDLTRGMRDLFGATASWMIVDAHAPSLDLARAPALD
jgi:DNA/RNA-binding domain of Phe-tRNA-synthetase-like protein